MLRRNPFSQVLAEARAVAARDATAPAQLSAPVSSASSGAQAGTSDSLTGLWVGYGLVDITPVVSFRAAE